MYFEKKNKLNKKGFELGFLNGLISGRKKLKMNLTRDDPRPDEDEDNIITAKNNQDIGFILDNDEKLKISKEIPKLFKIPFWLVSLPKEKKVFILFFLIVF